MKRSRFSWRGLFIIGALVGLSGSICPNLADLPNLATMLIYFPGNDTVIVNIEVGMVQSGPAEIFGNTDISVELFAANGEPDGRLTELTHRIDVTPADTSLLAFTRATGFSGTLIKKGNGPTSATFGLFNIATGQYLFQWPIDINIY